MSPPTSLDRLLLALRAIVRAELPRLTFYGTYGYTVQSASASTVDVLPVDTTISLPGLTGVPLASGLLGQVVTANAGLARIRFVNGDPARPVCVGLGSVPANTTVGVAGELDIGPSASTVVLRGGVLGVARVGDSVTLYFPTGCFVTGTVTVGATVTPITSITILNGFGAILQGGSPNVETQ